MKKVNKNATWTLKVAAVLWLFWGFIHALAGVMTIIGDTTTGFQAISDGVNPELLKNDYHAAVGAVLNQHGWNLLWGGVVTMIGGILIWRANLTAIWVTAMIGGLLDVGYFVFIDLGGFNHFVPGTVMTIISATAILLSSWYYLQAKKTLS